MSDVKICHQINDYAHVCGEYGEHVMHKCYLNTDGDPDRPCEIEWADHE